MHGMDRKTAAAGQLTIDVPAAAEQFDRLMNKTDIGLSKLAAIVEHIERSENLESEILKQHGELISELTKVQGALQAWRASLSNHSKNVALARLLARATEIKEEFTRRGTAIEERLAQCVQRLIK